MRDTFDPLSCSNCSGKFNNSTKQPHYLQCFHTFCLECLKQLAKPPSPPSPSGPQLVIVCSLCAKATPCSAASTLPINYALRDVVEATITIQDKQCDFHEETHAATHWCFDCEQGMCDEAHSFHCRGKSTKHHQTNKIGTQPPVIHKQALCSIHNRELEFVCTHSSHAPQVICISCVVTSHQMHPCTSAVEYFVEKQDGLRGLLELAKETETKLENGAEMVGKEHAAIAGNREDVTTSINSYFAKILSELESCRTELLTKLDSAATAKATNLHKQREALLASLDGIQKVAQQLDLTAGYANSQAKALVLMDQLQQHLKVVAEVRLQPQELAVLRFQGDKHVPPNVSVIDDTAIAVEVVASNGNSFPILLATHLAASRFEISSGIELKITTPSQGRYEIYPVHNCFGEQLVNVKMLGHHVKGSPVKVNYRATWSTTNKCNGTITDNVILSTNNGGWGMIQQVFGMAPQSLTITVDHKRAHPWAQLALYTSPAETIKAGHDLVQPLACFTINGRSQGTVSIFKLERQKNGQVTLFLDDVAMWTKEARQCYVYIDIFHATTTAEIVQ